MLYMYVQCAIVSEKLYRSQPNTDGIRGRGKNEKDREKSGSTGTKSLASVKAMPK